MTRDEWRALHAKLNASWPRQQIPPETAAIWYEDLAPFAEGEVWLAIRRHRANKTPNPRTGKPYGAFAPELAEILAAIDANFREMAEQRREQERELERRSYKPGVPMPPETKEAMKIMAEAKKPENGTGPEQANAMIQALADQIALRARPEEDVA